MSTDGQTAKQRSKEDPAISVRELIYVYPDRVWCALFVGKPGGLDIQHFAQSFDRPEGRTDEECIARAQGKLAENRPVAYAAVKRVREQW